MSIYFLWRINTVTGPSAEWFRWVFNKYKWQDINEGNRYLQVNNKGHWDNPVWYFLDTIMGTEVPWGKQKKKWNSFRCHTSWSNLS